MTIADGQALAELVSSVGGLEAKRARGTEYGDKEHALRNLAAREFPRGEPAHLAGLLTASASGAYDENVGYLYGPVNSSGGSWLPVFALSWNFEGQLPILRLRAALCMKDPEGDGLIAYGLRFETPEGRVALNAGDRESAEKSSHNYFHCQPISSFSKGDRPLPGPQPINTSQPAVPVDCQSPVSLALACLIALYDVAVVRDELLHGLLGLRPFIKQMQMLTLADGNG